MAAQQIAELQQRLQQLEQNPGIRRINQKLSRFSNEPGDDWLVFKNHLQRTLELNGYDDLQSRLALASCMSGKAALATLDIQPRQNQGNAEITFPNLLQLYEDRFMPASASQIARVRFDAARQGAHEDVLEFHGRLRALYSKAYPNANDDTNLIRRFIMGLRRRDIRTQAMRHNPQTYAGALEVAQNEASVVQMVRVTEMGAAALEEPMEIGALDPAEGRGARSGDCHFCGKAGHWKRECNLLKKAQAAGRGRGRGRGGPAGGRGGAPRRNLVAALEAALHDIDETEVPEDGDAGGAAAAAGSSQDF